MKVVKVLKGSMPRVDRVRLTVLAEDYLDLVSIVVEILSLELNEFRSRYPRQGRNVFQTRYEERSATSSALVDNNCVHV